MSTTTRSLAVGLAAALVAALLTAPLLAATPASGGLDTDPIQTSVLDPHLMTEGFATISNAFQQLDRANVDLDLPSPKEMIDGYNATLRGDELVLWKPTHSEIDVILASLNSPLPVGSRIQSHRVVAALNDVLFVIDWYRSAGEEGVTDEYRVSIAQVPDHQLGTAPLFEEQLWPVLTGGVDGSAADGGTLELVSLQATTSQNSLVIQTSSMFELPQTLEIAMSDQCQDLCGEAGTGAGVVGGFACGAVALAAGLPTGGLGAVAVLGGCAVIGGGVGVLSNNLCSNDYGTAHVACRPTDYGQIIFGAECAGIDCIVELVLHDRRKALHGRLHQISFTWYQIKPEPYVHYLGGPYNDWPLSLSRLDAGTFLTPATYHGSFDTTGRSVKLSHYDRNCAHEVSIVAFFIESGVWNDPPTWGNLTVFGYTAAKKPPPSFDCTYWW